MTSQPCALFEFRSFTTSRIASRDSITSLIRLHVLNSKLRREFPTSIIEHCFAKLLLKMFDFVRKFLSNILSTSRGGIVGFLFLPRKRFNIDQYALGPVLGSFSLLPRFEKYDDLEDDITSG